MTWINCSIKNTGISANAWYSGVFGVWKTCFQTNSMAEKEGVRVSSLRSLAFPSSLPLISSARMDIGNNRLCESYPSIRLLWERFFAAVVPQEPMAPRTCSYAGTKPFESLLRRSRPAVHRTPDLSPSAFPRLRLPLTGSSRWKKDPPYRMDPFFIWRRRSDATYAQTFLTLRE